MVHGWDEKWNSCYQKWQQRYGTESFWKPLIIWYEVSSVIWVRLVLKRICSKTYEAMLLRKCNNPFFKLLTHFKLSDVTFNASLEDVQPSCFFFGVYSWKKLLQSKHNKVKKILYLLNTDRNILKKWLEFQAAHFRKKRKTKEDNLHVHRPFFIICFMIQYKKSQLSCLQNSSI